MERHSSVVRAQDCLTTGRSWVWTTLEPLWNFGNSVYPTLRVSFGGDTKSRRSLLSSVYGWESKISHTGGKWVTCRGLHIAEKDDSEIKPVTTVSILTKMSIGGKRETPLQCIDLKFTGSIWVYAVNNTQQQLLWLTGNIPLRLLIVWHDAMFFRYRFFNPKNISSNAPPCFPCQLNMSWVLYYFWDTTKCKLHHVQPRMTPAAWQMSGPLWQFRMTDHRVLVMGWTTVNYHSITRGGTELLSQSTGWMRVMRRYPVLTDTTLQWDYHGNNNSDSQWVDVYPSNKVSPSEMSQNEDNEEANLCKT